MSQCPFPMTITITSLAPIEYLLHKLYTNMTQSLKIGRNVNLHDRTIDLLVGRLVGELV